MAYQVPIWNAINKNNDEGHRNVSTLLLLHADIIMWCCEIDHYGAIYCSVISENALLVFISC